MSIVVALSWGQFCPPGQGTGGFPTGIWWVEARDAAKYSTMSRRGPHNKELSSPKCQCQKQGTTRVTLFPNATRLGFHKIINTFIPL